MKLACVAPDDLSTVIFCKTLCALADNTGNIRVTTFSPVDHFKSELTGVKSTHVAIPMERFIAPWHDLRYFWSLFRYFRRGRFDAVLTFTTKPNIYGVLAAKLAGIPTIIPAIRGLGRGFDRQHTIGSRALYLLISRLYRLSCALSTTTWFTNPNDLRHFIDQKIVDTERVLLTTNAVDLSIFHPEAVSAPHLSRLRSELGLDETKRIVIMVARLVWSKGIKEFVDCAQLVGETLSNVHFLLVAPPEPGAMGAVPEAYLHDAMQRYRNFTWLSFRKDVVDLYALADLAVLPSWYKEGGYPRALLEPMAMGKPVIAADTDDCRSPVEHGRNGFVVPVRNAHALASAVTDIMTNEDLRNAFGTYSLRKAKAEFDDQIVFRKILTQLVATTAGA